MDALVSCATVSVLLREDVVSEVLLQMTALVAEETAAEANEMRAQVAAQAAEEAARKAASEAERQAREALEEQTRVAEKLQATLQRQREIVEERERGEREREKREREKREREKREIEKREREKREREAKAAEAREREAKAAEEKAREVAAQAGAEELRQRQAEAAAAESAERSEHDEESEEEEDGIDHDPSWSESDEAGPSKNFGAKRASRPERAPAAKRAPPPQPSPPPPPPRQRQDVESATSSDSSDSDGAAPSKRSCHVSTGGSRAQSATSVVTSTSLPVAASPAQSLTAQPVPQPGAVVAASVKRYWACETCTLLNEDVVGNCAACGAPQPLLPGGWACPTCTFRNSSGSRCEACDAPRELIE